MLVVITLLLTLAESSSPEKCGTPQWRRKCLAIKLGMETSEYLLGRKFTVETDRMQVSDLNWQCNMLSIVNLSCSVSGVPQPYVHFVRQDGQPLSSTTVVSSIQGNTTVLTIRNFRLSDDGVYLCIANSIAGEARDSFKVSISQCILDGNDTILVGKSRFILKTLQTADVILLFDESGSMSMEHSWIPNMVVELDGMLRKQTIASSSIPVRISAL
ncbi:hypothetical protein EMCRGX_G017017 [Ephydatia muelleri]